MTDTLTVRKDLVLAFGDRDDGALGIPTLTKDGEVIETSYFYGTTRPKNIIVVSSQAGCPMKCAFCELGSARFGRSLSPEEMRDQALLMLGQAALHGFDASSTPHKITVANSGEPLLNSHLTDGLNLLAGIPVRSFKVSTVLPESRIASETLVQLASFAASQARPVQLQISLISTSEEARLCISGGKVAGFARIREVGELWRAANPHGRKVNLSLIITSDMPCNARDVAAMFPPELFRFRFREYVPTKNGEGKGLRVISAARLAEIKKDFGDHGYEVTDWASPSLIERKFSLAANVIRKLYLDMTSHVLG